VHHSDRQLIEIRYENAVITGFSNNPLQEKLLQILTWIRIFKHSLIDFAGQAVQFFSLSF